MTILKLSKESFLKAKAFIFEQARPLEQALFQYHFENGSTEEVIFRLNQFQNNDGGFGNALEPDIRLPQSSVIATTIGLQILREINTDTKAIEVQNAIKYLLKQYDPSINAWHNVSQIVNNYPHAPWWTFKTEHGLTYSERFQPNSGAEILAHFWHYDGLIEDKKWLHTMTELCVNMVKNPIPDRWMHDSLCYLKLAETKNIEENMRASINTEISQQAAHFIETNPSKWNEYCAKPLWFAPTPNSPLYNILSDAVSNQLDYEIKNQNQEDGAWSPFWSWFGDYPNDWKIAEIEWKGILTLKTLKALKACQRIEM